MIEALVHGKLSREQENMEDLLTSAVFGRLRHLPPTVLGKFLARARTLAEEHPLRSLEHVETVEYQFWPTLEAVGCLAAEPDLVLRCQEQSGLVWHILVEAKYKSGKSSRADDLNGEASTSVQPPRDQLAREWENVSALSSQRSWVVYLTPALSFPRRDIREAQDELRRKGRPEGRFCWLSWRALAHLALAEPLFQDLQRILDRLDLNPFEGARAGSCPSISWRFAIEPWRRATVSAPVGLWHFDDAGHNPRPGPNRSGGSSSECAI